MGFRGELQDAWFGPPALRAALARVRRATTAGERLEAARDALRAKPDGATARRLLADERLWVDAFFERFTLEVERAGPKAVALEPYRELIADGSRHVTHPRALAAPKAAVRWIESARAVDNIGLTEAERLLRGFGYARLADRVKLDVEAIKKIGHSGPIRDRRAKGLPLPPPTVWSAKQVG